ncbi:carboxymuconolactone decarboxylase family protein [Pseudonocardia sp. RS010]|uniref:carboxymuconolactone decarboxylase family protein n=1 Tax=Pseudonocardia sp. RS010 TaxID=3385979 RepID=UPI0039A0EAD8
MNSSDTAVDRAGQLLPEAPWLTALGDNAPKFTEGLARVADVIVTDGALPAGLKALFAAAICAVKRDEGLLEHFLTTAHKEDVGADRVAGAAVGLLISRGVRPHELFVTAAERAYGGPVGIDAAPGTAEAEVAGAYAYFQSYFGAVPDYVELLGERAGRALEGYFLMREAALGETPLPPRDMELLLCAVNAAEYQARFVAIHARGARRAGATEEQLVEATLTAMPFAGVASWLPAAQGVIDSRDVVGP